MSARQNSRTGSPRPPDLTAQPSIGSAKGTPSKASAPRPIALIASTMRPCRPSMASASVTSRMFGVADGDSQRSVLRQFHLVALRRQRRRDDVGRRGRAADAGVAVDDQRPRAVPLSREVEQRPDMRFARRRHALARLGDVVQRQEEMVLLRDRRRPRHRRAGGKQRDQPLGPGRCNRRVDLRQRTDMDHREPPSPAEAMPAQPSAARA